MTTLAFEQPRLLTAAEFAALPEAHDGRYELQEGHVQVSPSPVPEHSLCLAELHFQMRDQVPAHLRAVPEVDVDLVLAPSDEPGWVRIPDLVVATKSGLARRRKEGGVLRAAEIVLAVEIVSRGSKRMDYTIKRGEYADSGIPHYWIIDLEHPSLLAFHRPGKSGYAIATEAKNTFQTTAPFPVTLDLDALV